MRDSTSRLRGHIGYTNMQLTPYRIVRTLVRVIIIGPEPKYVNHYLYLEKERKHIRFYISSLLVCWLVGDTLVYM